MPAEPDFLRLLALLDERDVEYVLVGGLAAIIHGSPVMTEDLDFVYRVEPSNLERLAAALSEIGATYRDPAGRVIHPTVDRLARYRVNLLDSALGYVDALRTIGDKRDYATLVDRSEWFELEGRRIRVLDLETIIETKAFADRPKDRVSLPILRTLLEMQQSGHDS